MFRVLSVLASLLLLSVAADAARAQDPSPADMVDALNAVFGKHKHTRAGHAKGYCVTGSFTPSPDAPSLSKAQQFAKTVPVIGRFSLGGGNPEAPDNAKDNVKGLALRFDLGDGANTDLVMISAPVFLAKTPKDFFDLLMAIASGDQDKVGAYFAAHPESKNQAAWLNARPVPASYAGVDYWGVHAFTMTNAEGKETLMKFKAIPQAGELGLTDAEAEAKGANFLDAELKERLAEGPVAFDLVAIVGRDGDPTDDPTALWDEDNREKTALGTVTIDALAPEATCDAFSFLPSNLADGVAGPANDTLFQIRSPAYIVSFTRRLAP
ncbi:MAG: catalase family peroxidase [Hyphomicrobiales bacterium]